MTPEELNELRKAADMAGLSSEFAELEALRADAERLRSTLQGAMVALNDGALAGSNYSLYWLNQARAALAEEKASCNRHSPCEKLPDGYCARCHSEAYP
jgi:hypothetical protein